MIHSKQHLTAIVGDRLTDDWRPAFTATPRELFVPDRALCVHDNKVKTPIDRDADLNARLRAVYSDDFTVSRERHWVWLDDPANAVLTRA